ncbi:hypothetical protein [Nocardioides sp. KR10-350]|uniref:hypothetical protein n=1 Tax=Nocardioides cheoyonin TaxID=3156615 RepID=UPI0032B51272
MTAFPGPGQQLGRYLLQRQLGQSASTAVYEATDTTLRRTVGLTVAVPGASRPADFRNRLAREAATIARGGTGLGLQILDVGETAGLVHVVTQPLPESSVQGWLGALDAAVQRLAGPPIDGPTQLPGTSPVAPPPAYDPTRISRRPAAPPPGPATSAPSPGAPPPPPWSTPQQAGQPPPPGGLYATQGLPYAAGPPPRKRRTRLIVLAAALAVVLIAAAAMTWAYFSGRLGIGPLSGDDKAVAAVVADGVDAPDWADDEQVSCASDKLLHQRRAGDLQDDGVVIPDKGAERGWRYTGRWTSEDAHDLVEGLLDCTDDWADEVGSAWHLSSTSCLDDVGASSIAGVIADDALRPTDDGLDDDNDRTADALDKCYAADPEKPKGRVVPGYRSVQFNVATPTAENGVAELRAGAKVVHKSENATSYSVETDAGGERACLRARSVVTYGWGTSRTSESQLCGRSKPPRIWWAKEKSCTEAPGCIAYQLHVEGFTPYDDLKVHNVTDGNFNCGSSCDKTIEVEYDGRGVGNGWYFTFTPHGTMTAKVGKYSDTIRFK